MYITIEGKEYSVPDGTKLGDHLHGREDNYFIDTEEKFMELNKKLQDSYKRTIDRMT